MRGAAHIEKPKKGVLLCRCEKDGPEMPILRRNLTWLPSGFSKLFQFDTKWEPGG